MDADDRKWLAKGFVDALLTTAATELVKWAIGALKDRKPVEKDRDGFVVVE
jgi:hypothetical protein